MKRIILVDGKPVERECEILFAGHDIFGNEILPFIAVIARSNEAVSHTVGTPLPELITIREPA